MKQHACAASRQVMASPVDDPRRHHKITVTTVNPHLEKEVINWLRPGPKEAPAEDPEVLQQQVPLFGANYYSRFWCHTT